MTDRVFENIFAKEIMARRLLNEWSDCEDKFVASVLVEAITQLSGRMSEAEAHSFVAEATHKMHAALMLGSVPEDDDMLGVFRVREKA
jgi:hypothetical protein